VVAAADGQVFLQLDLVGQRLQVHMH